MQVKRFVILWLCSFHLVACAQRHQALFDAAEVKRIETILASDEMMGRKAGTAGSDKAAQFIAGEFKKAGLQSLEGDDFLQHFAVSQQTELSLQNVVGVLPGKTRPEEFVIFSAHYDHLGTGQPVNGDSIYNGANDDAAGVTAVIMLARHFSQQDNNARTLLFVAFTAEESGGLGSRYFSQQLDPQQIVAMINIEMIGTESKWGKASAFITGYDQSDMGKIMQQNLKGTPFTFHPDPYTPLQLFYRSDNATLARLGVPAHTISTSKMDDEKFYHTVDDEVETLDFENMAIIIEAIAKSSKSIIAGTDTPVRIKNIH